MFLDDNLYLCIIGLHYNLRNQWFSSHFYLLFLVIVAIPYKKKNYKSLFMHMHVFMECVFRMEI